MPPLAHERSIVKGLEGHTPVPGRSLGSAPVRSGESAQRSVPVAMVAAWTLLFVLGITCAFGPSYQNCPGYTGSSELSVGEWVLVGGCG